MREKQRHFLRGFLNQNDLNILQKQYNDFIESPIYIRSK